MGKDSSIDSIGVLKLKYHLYPFIRLTLSKQEKFYSKAFEYAALTGTEKVIEVYSGYMGDKSNIGLGV